MHVVDVDLTFFPGVVGVVTAEPEPRTDEVGRGNSTSVVVDVATDFRRIAAVDGAHRIECWPLTDGSTLLAAFFDDPDAAASTRLELRKNGTLVWSSTLPDVEATAMTESPSGLWLATRRPRVRTVQHIEVTTGLLSEPHLLFHPGFDRAKTVRDKMIRIMSQIIAIGGGGFLDDHDPLMHRYVLAQAAGPSPKICLLATGKGDAPAYAERFYTAYGRQACTPTHLGLFDREVSDLETFVLGQDVILVWGGNTASMLAVWRAHGLDRILRLAATRGVVLAGLCAGAIGWFESGVTDSFGGLDALHGGLGLLPGSHCPHYDADPERRATYHRLIESGDLPTGVAADVDVAMRYEDGHLAEVVASREDAFAWRVTADAAGVHEEKVLPRVLS